MRLSWPGLRWLTQYRPRPDSRVAVPGSGELLLFDLGDELEIGAADQLFFAAGRVLEEDNIDIVKGGELFLDRPDELFVPEADLLSVFKVHKKRLGWEVDYPLSQERVKEGCRTVTKGRAPRCPKKGGSALLAGVTRGREKWALWRIFAFCSPILAVEVTALFDPDAHLPRINRGMVYLGACLIAGIRLAREKQVNTQVVPTRHAIEESVDLAYEIFCRVFRRVPEEVKGKG